MMQTILYDPQDHLYVLSIGYSTCTVENLIYYNEDTEVKYYIQHQYSPLYFAAYAIGFMSLRDLILSEDTVNCVTHNDRGETMSFEYPTSRIPKDWLPSKSSYNPDKAKVIAESIHRILTRTI